MKRILLLSMALFMLAGHSVAQEKNKAYIVSNAHFD